MNTNNLILNRLFTQNTFFDTVCERNTETYGAIIQRFVNDPEKKDNGTLISEIYKYMSKSYRNEYFYQNTLLNKLLLGKHSINTTTALTQIPISKSKADFILINGKAVVYEIKTELDTFERLPTQLHDYYKAFASVCVVTSEGQYNRALDILKDTHVGIYVLTDENTFSTKMRKEPKDDFSHISHLAMFKVLHKHEFENVLLKYYGILPNIAQVFYYNECFKQFSNIPLADVYEMFLKELKKRNKIRIREFTSVPYELKSLVYFSKVSEMEWQDIDKFLKTQYGG